MKIKSISILLPAILLFSLNAISCRPASVAPAAVTYQPSQNTSRAYFASGCFWCVEAIFESVYGVENVISGYSGGSKADASYELVSSGSTNHAETVEVYYDSTKISYATLVRIFFDSHDATTLNRQGPDSGRQYRSAIFYQNESEKNIAADYIASLYAMGQYPKGSITTTLEKFNAFYPAEAYHQDYEKLNPNQPYIRAVSIPRLKKFQSKNPDLLKKQDSKH